ncbi:MAG: NAD(P)H-hydrate epimerase, partial [Chrysiogenetes bacterium]|nr:NAD(P)H-hydrate epimerase [Chrysiogenetes bacterium]
MKPLYSAEEMRALDKRAIEEARIPGLVLMENAGLKTFQIILEKTGGAAGMPVSVLCGKGNNGGDGFVVARHLQNHGAQVRVHLFAPIDAVSGDARAMLDAWMGMGGDLVDDVGDEQSMKDLAEDLADSEIVIDALLGTGLESEVRGAMADAIEMMNDTPGMIFALDIPSGISADTGHVMGTAVQADITCTYGGMKPGHWIEPGRAHCGEMFEIEISLPFEMLDAHQGSTYLLTPEDVWPGLFHRLPDAHKGNFGHLLAIAGSHGKSGAGVLASRAAHRIGAGLVTLAIPRGLESVVAPQSVETMTELLTENDEGGYGKGAGARLLEAASSCTAVLIGPGIPTDAASGEAVLELMKKCELPLVIDADGLNLLAKNSISPGKLASEQIVVTPHPGEMSRLSGFTTQEVQADRVGV